MILQALAEHYDVLVKQTTTQTTQRQIAPRGWTYAKISFALCIDDDGELERVESTRTGQTQEKKTVMAPRLMSLPAPVKRSSGIASNFLWDNSSYLLGVDDKGKPQRSLDCFNACKALHHQLLDDVDSPAARALLAFFDRWEPARAAEHPALQEDWDELITAANLVFRYNGGYVHDDPLVRQAWQNHYGAAGDSLRMVCLVTGEKGPVEAVHPAIKGVAGGQSSGTALVSFNAPAFCSYGREQSLNAPVSKQAAFAYTAALNYMIADRAHARHLGDTTVLFWARSGQAAFQDFFSAFAFGGDTPYDEGALAHMLESLLQGDAVQYDETLLDPDMDFYILGLSPNAARLSVRFFLRSSFGGFLANIRQHHDRLNIIRPSFDKRETISLKDLLDATVNQHSRDKAPSSVMTGEVMRAILADTRYPASLLNGVTLRIRAEHEVDRTRAAILKAYYLKTSHSNMPKDIVTKSPPLPRRPPSSPSWGTWPRSI